ncbi:MAG TPA: DUF4926 domain-containing protein [Burkholderiaceae bacterium]
MKFTDLDVVTALIAMPAAGIAVGAVGTIVDVFDTPEGYLVEFSDGTGATLATEVFAPTQLEPFTPAGSSR